jgi:FKBP-type peptidyl-prolyl cis-trans isomerase FklB
MKQLLVLSSVWFTISSYAQVPSKTPAPKISPSAPQLKTMNDTFSYALGVQVASFYKQQGVKKINTAALARAINDIYGKGKSYLSQKEIDLAILGETSPEQYAAIKNNVEAGERFLKENKNKPGVFTTPSGLQYEVLTQGNGEKPGLQDTVVCHYKGSFLNGTVFEDSHNAGGPATFALTGVIKGWTEALQLMNVGSKYRLYLPNELGYGIMDYGAIPGGSTLIFEVELLEIKKAGH